MRSIEELYVKYVVLVVVTEFHKFTYVHFNLVNGHKVCSTKDKSALCSPHVVERVVTQEPK